MMHCERVQFLADKVQNPTRSTGNIRIAITGSLSHIVQEMGLVFSDVNTKLMLEI